MAEYKGKQVRTGVEAGKRDSGKSQMEKVTLRTVWVAFLLLQMYQAFLSLTVLYFFAKSGPTSELNIVRKNAFSSCSSINVQMVAGSHLSCLLYFCICN